MPQRVFKESQHITFEQKCATHAKKLTFIGRNGFRLNLSLNLLHINYGRHKKFKYIKVIQ